MPLKDLAIDTAKLTEKQIEEIVAPYVNYDVEKKRVVLRPEASSLPNRIKVLVYLVALRGWPFLDEEGDMPTAATPAHMGSELNIRGGSLRPVLKELRNSTLS